MYSVKEFMRVLEGFAPLLLSYKMIEKGAYDNSGVIVKNHDKIKKALFSLDLSNLTVERALELDCDTIVTHHPAIYSPIKSLDEDGDTAALLTAIKNGLNVISMHLNLDIAKNGIDQSLMDVIGGKNSRVIDIVDGECGYGKESVVERILAEEFLQNLKEKFSSDKIILYGFGEVNKVASFCGAGSSDALSAVEKGLTDADTIITSDLPHHVLKALIERQKKVIIIPHYVAENKGFEKFYEYVMQNCVNFDAYYFVDKRFM